MCKFQVSDRRRGFTILELVVVIAVIGMLVALLLPAVQAAREAARSITCRNNLKQLGVALHNYHGGHGTFPFGAVGPIAGSPQFDGLKQHGLGMYLLPYLEQAPLADHYSRDFSWFDPPNQTVVNTQLEVFMCPSARANRIQDGRLPTVRPPPEEPFNGTAACGDYAGMNVVFAGLADNGRIDPPGGSRDERQHYEGVFAINHTRRVADIPDGTAYTIMMAECAGRPQLWRGGKEVQNTWVSGGPWASRNLLWCRGTMSDGTLFGTCAINCTNNREVYSFHPGGANVLFADGNVRPLKATIDIRVFARLVTRDGGEIVTAGDF